MRRLLPYVANLDLPGIRRFLLKLLPFSNIQKVRKIVDILD